ncbi:MAG: 4Fe-4S dicluster domain-containing protein, partial [Lentisphaeria bacterium]|nr:4Fe-4S dicluster domain-containing protein [Lentisphaeria bacterium]
CPKGVLFIGKALNQRGYTHVEYKGEGCTGCGNCFYACPEPHTIKVHTGRRDKLQDSRRPQCPQS